MEPIMPNTQDSTPEQQNVPREAFCLRCGSPVHGRFCSCCGFPVDASPSPPPIQNTFVPPPYPASTAAPKVKGRIPLILLSIAAGTAVFIMLLFMAAHFVLSNTAEFPEVPTLSPSMNVNREGVSAEEYQKLSVGMTYAQISAIIGGDGSLVGSGENAYGKAYYIYGWKGEANQNAVVYITFVDDAVSEISVDGSLS